MVGSVQKKNLSTDWLLHVCTIWFLLTIVPGSISFAKNQPFERGSAGYLVRVKENQDSNFIRAAGLVVNCVISKRVNPDLKYNLNGEIYALADLDCLNCVYGHPKGDPLDSLPQHYDLHDYLNPSYNPNLSNWCFKNMATCINNESARYASIARHKKDKAFLYLDQLLSSSLADLRDSFPEASQTGLRSLVLKELQPILKLYSERIRESIPLYLTGQINPRSWFSAYIPLIVCLLFLPILVYIFYQLRKTETRVNKLENFKTTEADLISRWKPMSAQIKKLTSETLEIPGKVETLARHQDKLEEMIANFAAQLRELEKGQNVEKQTTKERTAQKQKIKPAANVKTHKEMYFPIPQKEGYLRHSAGEPTPGMLTIFKVIEKDDTITFSFYPNTSGIHKLSYENGGKIFKSFCIIVNRDKNIIGEYLKDVQKGELMKEVSDEEGIIYKVKPNGKLVLEFTDKI